MLDSGHVLVFSFALVLEDDVVCMGTAVYGCFNNNKGSLYRRRAFVRLYHRSDCAPSAQGTDSIIWERSSVYVNEK